MVGSRAVSRAENRKVVSVGTVRGVSYEDTFCKVTVAYIKWRGESMIGKMILRRSRSIGVVSGGVYYDQI